MYLIAQGFYYNHRITNNVFILQVYTVGPDYQHAEARKSPALDGKVERDQDGKEIRYPVLLSNREKMIARNVCKVFKVLFVFNQLFIFYIPNKSNQG